MIHAVVAGKRPAPRMDNQRWSKAFLVTAPSGTAKYLVYPYQHLIGFIMASSWVVNGFSGDEPRYGAAMEP